MEETKVHYRGEQVIDDSRTYPPPYSSGVPPEAHGSPPPAGPYGTNVIQTAPVGMVGTHVGMVGTNVGMVGTNLGMHGTDVNMVPSGVVPVMMAYQISPKPQSIICKSCHSQIVTRIESQPTLKTHFFAAVLCLMGCWCCVCIPYFTDNCMNRDHYCPNCNAFIGSYIP